MSRLPFGELPPYRDRRFVPPTVDWEKPEEVARLFDILEEKLAGCDTPADLERWLLDESELSAAVSEERTRRYIAMTTHTEDADAESAYLRFVETIQPLIRERSFRLAKLYTEHPLRSGLPRERYFVLDREAATQVRLFRPENVPLQTEETRLGQQYQKLSGSLTVEFQGREQTLVQMAMYLEEPDRDLRRQAWELTARRRLQEAEAFEDIFDRLLELRNTIARNAGFANYVEYAFLERGRFDYTPQDCLEFHAAIEQEVLPLMRELQEERRRAMGIDTLRPWDLAADPQGRPPLRPFQDAGELAAKAERVLTRLDPALGGDFRLMRELRLLDLDNRKGKAPGGYQSTLSEARLPFIFMNAVGIQRDVETILHEAGHAFHALATRDEDLHSYRHAPLEFAEVASMSMELLGSAYLEEFYSPEEAARARRAHLEGIVTFFPWMAVVDAFQHWVYTHPGHTREERAEAFDALMERFGGDVDWSGLEDLRRRVWHRQLHIFLSPFYYVEYGIAQLGALQVWGNWKRSGRQALEAYRRALALGGSRPMPELFQAAGAQFRFDAGTIRPLMRMLREELAESGRT